MKIDRKYIEELKFIGDFSPVLGILGPRQVGKTTLAKEYAKLLKESGKGTLYLDLEKPSDLQKLRDAELFLSSNMDKCIILDEVQLMPDLFPLIRALVDEKRMPLRFIILGSASPSIIKGASESLAGRISYIQMNPLSLSEIPEISIQNHHFYGGFPNSILSANKQSVSWMNNFIKTYIERDLQLLGISASPQVTRRLWEMLAWQSGNLLNNSSLGKSLGLTNHTINRYLDFLEGAFMIHRIPAFSINMKKRIVKSPKVYLADTGVLHQLLRINSYNDLFGNPIVGHSWENYVVQQIIAEKPNDLELYFYRTHAGTEVDVVITRALKPIASVEIKFSSSPNVSKGFLNGIEDLQTSKNYIVIPKEEDYLATKSIKVLGVKKFILEELKSI